MQVVVINSKEFFNNRYKKLRIVYIIYQKNKYFFLGSQSKL